MPKSYKPTVLVDFDGVIHRYSKGWQDGSVYDGPMEGAKEALLGLENLGYEVVIFSTRDAEQIKAALWSWQFRDYRVTNQKLPAVAIIDDRAINFKNWGDAVNELTERYPIKR